MTSLMNYGYVGETRYAVAQNIPELGMREVQVTTPTIAGVVERTKPVAQSMQYQGVPYGFAVVRCGREFVRCTGYNELAAVISALEPGSVVVIDGAWRVITDGGVPKRFFQATNVMDIKAPAPAPVTAPPAATADDFAGAQVPASRRPAGRGRRSVEVPVR